MPNASMRPRHKAAENVVDFHYDHHDGRSFNEAAA